MPCGGEICHVGRASRDPAPRAQWRHVYIWIHQNGRFLMLPTSGSRYRWRLGDIEITRVLEFEAALFEPAVIHPDVTAEIIDRHRSWLEPTLLNPDTGLMVFAFHSTVIRTPRSTILVDTCSGNDKERPHKQRYHRKNWPYLANLAAAGFA